jgi:hypothetical protein
MTDHVHAVAMVTLHVSFSPFFPCFLPFYFGWQTSAAARARASSAPYMEHTRPGTPGLRGTRAALARLATEIN